MFFAGINDYGVKSKLPTDRFTGVFEKKEIVPNLQLIQRIAPGVTDIVLVGDASETDDAIRHEVEADLAYQSRAFTRGSCRAAGWTNSWQGLRVGTSRSILFATLGAVRDESNQLLPLADTSQPSEGPARSRSSAWRTRISCPGCSVAM